MKKSILLVMLIALLSIGFSSCTSENKLAVECKAANKMCPINVGNGIKVTKIAYEDNKVVYTYDCPELTVGRDFIQNLEANKSEMKSMMRGMIESAPAGDDLHKLAQICKEADASIEFKYVGKPSGKSCSVILTPNEL